MRMTTEGSKMNKRQVIQGLLLPFFIAIRCFSTEKESNLGDFTYKKWRVRWTGWKTTADTFHLIGQYYAYKGADKHTAKRLYASYPGGEGAYILNQTFNIGLKEGQTIVCPHEGGEDLSKYQLDAKRRILALIDAEEKK